MKGPRGVPPLLPNQHAVAVLLGFWGAFFDPFTILLAGLASLKGLCLLAEVGEQVAASLSRKERLIDILPANCPSVVVGE